MTAPRGQPSHNLLDAFHRAYSQHEMRNDLAEQKKLTPLTAARRNELVLLEEL